MLSMYDLNLGEITGLFSQLSFYLVSCSIMCLQLVKMPLPWANASMSIQMVLLTYNDGSLSHFSWIAKVPHWSYMKYKIKMYLIMTKVFGENRRIQNYFNLTSS